MAFRLQNVSINDCWSDLLISQRYWDLKLICKEEEFKVHRAMVCSQSDVIARCVDRWQFQDNPTAQFQMGDDEEPKAVKAMIQFLYTSDYDWAERDDAKRTPPTSTGPEDDKFGIPTTTWEEYEKAASRLMFHAKIYVLADRYNIPALTSLAARRYSAYLAQWWDIPQLLELVDFVWTNTAPSNDLLRRFTADAATISLVHFMQKKHVTNATCMPEKESFPWYLLVSAADRLRCYGELQVRSM